MVKDESPSREESLDPADWEAMRSLGHRIVDDVIEYLSTVRARPPWRHAPDRVKAHFRKPIPLAPQRAEDVYEEFREFILPYPVGNIHPRFWGWVFSTGTVLGAYADFLASSMNTGSGDLAHHSALHVEKQVVSWLKEIMGFPQNASALLTTGTSAANLVALAVARNAKAGYDLRGEGMRKAEKDMVVYCSDETHSSIQKATELLGLGARAIRRIPTDDDFRIDMNLLEAAIDEDRRNGALPFCVVGNAGTVNTGAIDDLSGLADLCGEEGLFFHVDGAFGAWAVLSHGAREKVAGMERADSLAFDLHKWMSMPYEIGCVLVRDEEAHRNAFSLIPPYLSRDEEERGLAGGDQPWFTDYGFELSRGFRSLKAWMSFKEHGIGAFGNIIQQNIDQAAYLARLVEASPDLRLMAPVPLNVVCYRYVAPELDDPLLDELNRRLIIELQERGIAVISGTTIRGRFVLRVGHTNHRTRREDFDVLVSETIRLGRELVNSCR